MIVRKNIWLILIALLAAVTTSLSVVALNGKRLNGFTSNKLKQTDLSQYPTVDSETPGPSDPQKRAKRQAKGRKYNKEIKAVSPDLVQTVESFHWPKDFPAIPAVQSDVIVIGDVVNAEAFLSSDKTGVYSEFCVQVEEVLKASAGTSSTPGTLVIAEREGGQVRYPSGHISRLIVAGLDMPRVGRKYVFFLKKSEEDFYIVTAYELRGNKVWPLDNSPIFRIYENSEATVFLNNVRTAVAGISQKTVN